MLSPAASPDFFKPSPFTKRLVYFGAVGSVVGLVPFLLWPGLAVRLFGSSDYLPHVFCYLRRPALVWTHVTADSVIGVAYLAISVTLAYLVYKARRDIPFHWIFLAFGLFIIRLWRYPLRGSGHDLETDLRLFRGGQNLHRPGLADDSRRASSQRSYNPDLGAKGKNIRASDRHTARERGTKGGFVARSSSSGEK